MGDASKTAASRSWSCWLSASAFFLPGRDVLTDPEETHQLARRVHHRVRPGVEVPHLPVGAEDPLVVVIRLVALEDPVRRVDHALAVVRVDARQIVLVGGHVARRVQPVDLIERLGPLGGGLAQVPLPDAEVGDVLRVHEQPLATLEPRLLEGERGDVRGDGEDRRRSRGAERGQRELQRRRLALVRQGDQAHADVRGVSRSRRREGRAEGRSIGVLAELDQRSVGHDARGAAREGLGASSHDAFPVDHEHGIRQSLEVRRHAVPGVLPVRHLAPSATP